MQPYDNLQMDVFIEACRNKLAQNAHKDGVESSLGERRKQFFDEIEEARTAYEEFLQDGDVKSAEALMDELVDVANQSYLMYNNVRGKINRVQLVTEVAKGRRAVPLIPSSLRRLSEVPRWAICYVNQAQSVAEHSFHTTWIWLWLMQELKQIVRARDIRAVLMHDMEEAQTGDVPAPNKTKSPATALDNNELFIKCADLMEAMLFLDEERLRSDNSMLGEAYDDIRLRMQEHLDELWHRGLNPERRDIYRRLLSETHGPGVLNAQKIQ